MRTEKNKKPLSPVQRIDTYNGNTLYIKREDMIPFSFGGNKARKAQNFFAEIDAGDFGSVVTYGSSSSNHCRIVANMAVSRNMPCYIISPEEASEETYNSKMMQIFGAEITVVPVKEVADTIEKKLKALSEAAKKPYFIPGGGHGNPGTEAFVDCYEEILQYEEETGIKFDYIFHATGTGATQAGLVCGQLMHGDDRKIVGISIARRLPYGRNVVLKSISDYFEAKNLLYSESMIENATVFDDGYVGEGYGASNEDIRSTISDALKKFGIPMDETYVGKAYTGMRKYIEKENITNKNILFIHTGGTPLFFDFLKEGR